MDYNSEFIARMLPRLEWPVVKQAATVVRIVLWVYLKCCIMSF